MNSIIKLFYSMKCKSFSFCPIINVVRHFRHPRLSLRDPYQFDGQGVVFAKGDYSFDQSMYSLYCVSLYCFFNRQKTWHDALCLCHDILRDINIVYYNKGRRMNQVFMLHPLMVAKWGRSLSLYLKIFLSFALEHFYFSICKWV
jgi:hypothetical protein